MSPDIDSLQFQKAEFAEKACFRCAAPIGSESYQLGGQPVCSACGEQVRAQQQQPKYSWVLRGGVFGLGAALVCGIAYGMFRMASDWDLALISIGVGYLVGKAVRRGSYDLGGRRCQVLAVLLTYFAISISFAPHLHESIRTEMAKDKSQPPLPPAFTAVMAIGFSFAMPVAMAFEGFSGLLGIAILLFGLQRAWQQTARDPRLLTGPDSSESATLAAPG